MLGVLCPQEYHGWVRILYVFGDALECLLNCLLVHARHFIRLRYVTLTTISYMHHRGEGCVHPSRNHIVLFLYNSIPWLLQGGKERS